jgi:Glycosyltransferase family 87
VTGQTDIGPVRSRTSSALICLSAGIFVVLVQFALWNISEPELLFSDFYKAYYPAGQALLRDGPRQTWHIGEDTSLAFVNLPILGYLFVPLALFERPTAGFLFLGIGTAAALAMPLLLARWLQLRGREFAVLVMLFAANGPLVNSLREGNTTHIVGLLIIMSLISICSGRQFLAGVLLGFCALVKLPLMLFCAYYVVLQRWRIAAGAILAISLIVFASFLIFGSAINIGWYDKCVAPYLSGVVGAFNVQSIDAFLLRLVTGATLLWDWEPVEVSLAHRVARNLVIGAMLAAALILMWRANRARRLSPKRDTPALAALEFVLVLSLALVVSPLSWVHYYLLLLLPAALEAAGRLSVEGNQSATRWLIYGGLTLASLPVAIPDLEDSALGPFAARTAVSVWLFGGLLMIGGLMRAAWLGLNGSGSRG